MISTSPLPLLSLLAFVGLIGWSDCSTTVTSLFAEAFSSVQPIPSASFGTPRISLSVNGDWPSELLRPSRQDRQGAATGYRLHRPAAVQTSIHAQKKGGGSGGGGGDAVSKKGKMQVQLLETIPNIGQSGDIILVSSAVFQNQLKRGNKARLITDEEIERIEQKKAEEDQRMIEMAMQTKALLEEAMVENLGGEDQCATTTSSSGDDNDICGVALQLKRKAGPEGNLFGGVNPKMVLDALKERYPNGSWEGRQVKLLDMKDSNGTDVKGKDIKHVGDYTIRISLWRGIDVTFILSILPE